MTASLPGVTVPERDWRDNFQFYRALPGTKCGVCGSDQAIGLEPRFGYARCEACKDVPPTQR